MRGRRAEHVSPVDCWDKSRSGFLMNASSRDTRARRVLDLQVMRVLFQFQRSCLVLTCVDRCLPPLTKKREMQNEATHRSNVARTAWKGSARGEAKNTKRTHRSAQVLAVRVNKRIRGKSDCVPKCSELFRAVRRGSSDNLRPVRYKVALHDAIRSDADGVRSRTGRAQNKATNRSNIHRESRRHRGSARGASPGDPHLWIVETNALLFVARLYQRPVEQLSLRGRGHW